MGFEFRWNPYADQPHNVALREERLRHHLKYASSYFGLAGSNIRKAVPVLSLYHEYRKKMYEEEVRIDKPFAISVSPAADKNEKILDLLEEAGVRKTLVRVPSWEKDKLDVFEKFFGMISERGIELTVALLQQRDDVLIPLRWQNFLEDAFSRFSKVSSYFEIGHAWNRTKWGVWDFREYLNLARPALPLAEKYGVKLVGPAVIDFEFHLYAPVLDAVPFDKVSSILYVDRMGAPENKQFGWDTSKKVALLKAVVDGSCGEAKEVWITEVNWPLKGTGKYSPASGKPNVSEEEQADYLVRYFVLCLASGFVQRVYWWQLVAPGYGLIDSRSKEWRRRPAFLAMKTMVKLLEGSTFIRKGDNPLFSKIAHDQAMIFCFKKGDSPLFPENFAVCWTKHGHYDYDFPKRIVRVLSRDGEEISFKDARVKITSAPKYIFFE
jgi:hypothetical protein